MFSQVTAQLCARAEAFLSGNLEEVVYNYLYPLPLYLPSTQLVIRTPQEARAVLNKLRVAMLQRGVVAMKPKVSAIDLPRAGRFRVWVEWTELALPVEGTRTASVVYYCRNAASGFRIEMMDFVRPSMPELGPQFKALALSA
jgi:hypothetical protein